MMPHDRLAPRPLTGRRVCPPQWLLGLMLAVLGTSTAAGEPLAPASGAPAATPSAMETRLVAQTAAPRLRSEPARGLYLVADRGLLDVNFHHTVVMLADVGADGAFGLIINRPTKVSLTDALPELQDPAGSTDTLFIGGPVERTRVSLLTRVNTPPASSHPILDDLYISGSMHALREVIKREDHRGALRVYAGYAGWGPGQLDTELARGDWHLLEADTALVFDQEPERIWQRLIRLSSGRWAGRIPYSQLAASR